MEKFKFELIVGPMSCGKTEELLRRLKRATIARKKVKVFSPSVDTRAFDKFLDYHCIESRNGQNRKAVKVESSLDILAHIEPEDSIIGIDELQFFDENILEVVKKIIKLNKKVIGSGLDLDFKAESFGYMSELLCYADRVDKLTAICMKCGSEYANRTQRLINGEPASYDSPLIMIGGEDTYEARCINCYEIEDKKDSIINMLSSMNLNKIKEGLNLHS